MWCPVALLGAALLLHSLADAQDGYRPSPTLVRSKRLTTFGKTPATETEPKILSNPPDEGTKNLYVPYTHGIPRGKECRSDDDCAALEFTTCKVDSDRRKRCLCHDLQPPANGECATKKRDVRGYVLIGNRRPPKELHQACNYDHECIQGAECVVNGTVKANEKRCYCRFGYEEEGTECNSAAAVSAMVTLLFVSLALLTTQTN